MTVHGQINYEAVKDKHAYSQLIRQYFSTIYEVIIMKHEVNIGYLKVAGYQN